MHPSSISSTASDGRSLTRYFLLLFGLCLPAWIIGAIFDIELFPGFKLFQAGLAMPMIASLLLTYHERRWAGITALLRRTYDAGNIKPRIWFLPIFFVLYVLIIVYLWGSRTLAQFRFARPGQAA